MHAYLNWMLYKGHLDQLLAYFNYTVNLSILVHVRSHAWIWYNKTALIATGFCSSNLPDLIVKHSSLILQKCCKCCFIRALTLDVYHFIWQSVFFGLFRVQRPTLRSQFGQTKSSTTAQDSQIHSGWEVQSNIMYLNHFKCAHSFCLFVVISCKFSHIQ